MTLNADGTGKLLPNSHECFVCGEDNPAGLRVRFYCKDGIVKTRWTPAPHHCGYPNVLHGGVIAAVLDECMAWSAARSIGRMCVTGELVVRYRKRVPSDRALTVTSEVTEPGKRLVRTKATLTDDDGEEFAEAFGKFVPTSAQETLDVDDALLYRGDEERVFDALRAQQAGKNG